MCLQQLPFDFNKTIRNYRSITLVDIVKYMQAFNYMSSLKGGYGIGPTTIKTLNTTLS